MDVEAEDDRPLDRATVESRLGTLGVGSSQLASVGRLAALVQNPRFFVLLFSAVVIFLPDAPGGEASGVAAAATAAASIAASSLRRRLF